MSLWSDLRFEPRSALDHRCADLMRLIAPVDHNLVDLDYGAYSDVERGYFESALHEISHVVVLRGGIRAAIRRPLSDLLSEATPKFPEDTLALSADARDAAWAKANSAEITAIAVSVVASKYAGMPLDSLTIAEAATDGNNVRDLGSAREVVPMIEAAMKLPKVRRWGRDLGKLLSTNYVLAMNQIRRR